MSQSRVTSLILCLAVAACGGNPQPESAAATPENAPSEAAAPAGSSKPEDPNTVTAEEIAGTGAATAYDVVDRLHRDWLRDKLTGEPVSVYQDNQKLGGADALRQLAVRDVAELQYLDGRSAVMRWGPDAGGGVIVVVRNRN